MATYAAPLNCRIPISRHATIASLSPRPGRPCRPGVVRFFREEKSAPNPVRDADLELPSQLSKKPSISELPSVPLPSPAGTPSLPSTHPAEASPTPPPEAPQPTDAQPPGFTLRRLIVFSGLVLGYSAYYLTRNSLTYTAPVMVADPALGFSLSQIGAMTSIFPIAYGMSKFVSGVVGDRYSPTMLLGGGLLATAACNLAFGASNALPLFCVLWAANGLMQGVGAPSCARMLTSWFAARERGTYWGLWNVAHNMGGFVAPLVAAGAANALGWRWGMWTPGLAGLLIGGYVLLACRDNPEAVGFKPVEPMTAKRSSSGTGENPGGRQQQQQRGGGGGGKGLMQKAMDNVLRNPAIWALALTYFCVYVVRQGVTSWSVFYLMKEKGVADAAQAAVRVSGLELGGLAGSLVAGGLSDWLIRNQQKNQQGNQQQQQPGSVGLRVRVCMAYAAGLAAALAAFQALPATAPPALQWLSVAAIGFCIYGPQMMIGLCGAELVHPDSVGASQGVLGWVAYLGAANAGMPLSLVVERFGWAAYFSTLMAACGVAVLLLAPLAGLRSYTQQQQQLSAGQNGNGHGRDGDSGVRLKVA